MERRKDSCTTYLMIVEGRNQVEKKKIQVLGKQKKI
jgi:hypothetical protein